MLFRSAVRHGQPGRVAWPGTDRQNRPAPCRLFPHRLHCAPHHITARPGRHPGAGWQSGYATACKAVYDGSIPYPRLHSRCIPVVVSPRLSRCCRTLVQICRVPVFFMKHADTERQAWRISCSFSACAWHASHPVISLWKLRADCDTVRRACTNAQQFTALFGAVVVRPQVIAARLFAHQVSPCRASMAYPSQRDERNRGSK